LHLPAIHCVACVWLLENLFRLKPGIGQSRVNFARQEAIISFDPQQVELSAVAALLESIGYEPNLKLADLEGKRSSPVSRRLWLQLGVAGFVFGNTMLFSLPAYFGLDSLSGPTFRALVGWLSLGLGVPVVVYSAADFFRNSWLSFQQRRMTIDVPIAVGIAVIFLQSAAEVISGRGEGYFDSLAGLTFFLLCGRVFQQKTYDRLAFDRDYRSFFPLSVIRIRDRGVSVELARPHPSPCMLLSVILAGREPGGRMGPLPGLQARQRRRGRARVALEQSPVRGRAGAGRALCRSLEPLLEPAYPRARICK
jgi:Cu+-exporting ATPase